MKKLCALLIPIALLALLAGCPAKPVPVVDQVTGVTISGTGVTGTGESKEATVAIGTPLLLTATPTYTGNPDLSPAWASADAATVAVTAAGEVNGLVFTSAGVVVTVTVGGASDTVLVKVVNAVAGLTLEFDRDKLEFQTVPTTIYANAAAAGTPPTVVKSATNVITLTNTDGSLKDSSTVSPPVPLGSSYLLLKTPFAAGANFEAKAAIKLTTAVAASDKYMVGIGMVSTDANGLVTVDPDINVLTDSQLAMTAKRSHSSTPGVRSFYHKNNATIIGASDPNITMTSTALAEYHILTVKRVGTNITFGCNGVENTVPIITPYTDGTALGVRYGLAGAVKVGLMWAGVTADVEGLSISSLDDSGLNPVEVYKSGTMPTVAVEVFSIDVTGPAGVQSSSIDLNGSASATLQLSTAYTPSNASIGNSVAYSIADAIDTNISVNSAGLVNITGMGDGSATIVGTSGNGMTDTYVVTIGDSNMAATSVTIPSTLIISDGQTKTLSATIAPTGVFDKTVTWASNSVAILIDSVTGVVSVVGGTAVDTTANITATSNRSPTVTSNTCVVTVKAATTYTFPSANWWTGANQATFLASATIPAEGATTGFNLLATATLNSLDGLSYKSPSANQLRLRYSASGNAINYNGSTTTAVIPAVGSTFATGETALGRYVSVPLAAISTTNFDITFTVKPTSDVSSNKYFLVGVDGSGNYTVLASASMTTAQFTANPITTIGYSGALGTMTRVIIGYSREVASGGSGGLDLQKVILMGY